MKRDEQTLMNTIRAVYSNGDTRLFRQNVGQAWTGDIRHLRDGSLLIQNPRPFHSGFPGLADLGGWRSVEVTPAMVGQRIAVYVALEVKTPKGRVKDDQTRFLSAVSAAGGIAAVVRSTDDAGRALMGVDNGLQPCSSSVAGGVPAPTGE